MEILGLNVKKETEVERLMRKHEELLEEIAEIESALSEMVTDKVSTNHGTAEWKSSVRYNNEAIVKFLEESGKLDQNTKNLFITYDYTKIVNHFKDSVDKKPFQNVTERRFTISHKRR
jgi:uncharacterized protein YjgD (DUF1641 family)